VNQQRNRPATEFFNTISPLPPSRTLKVHSKTRFFSQINPAAPASPLSGQKDHLYHTRTPRENDA
jgi:hypothetical protein